MRVNVEKVKEIKTWKNKRVIETKDTNIVIELKDKILEVNSNNFNIVFNHSEKFINVTSNLDFSIQKENSSSFIVSFENVKFRFYVQKILVKITIYDASYNILFEDVFYLK